jgi:5-(carboxyamino)imidazole ribonucleotide synthase
MRIGILGGGQLGQMLALAGIPLGHRFVFLDPTVDSPEPPASAVGRLIVGNYDDPAALREFLASVDVVTFEFENVPAAALERIQSMASVPVRPGVEALRTGQDRLFEKTLFREVGLPVPEFACAATAAELHEAVARIGTPCVVKSRRMGYDGKGQVVLREASREAIDAAWASIRPASPGVIVEAFVPFVRELSILAVRGVDGSTAAYPLVENLHEGGILRRSIAPASGVSAAHQRSAETFAFSIMRRLDYVGVLAIEFFEVVANGVPTLWGNEMAPRVHNSGHWTIEGCVCSQFENHIRAIAGQPLGSTDMACGAAVMHNLIGTPRADTEAFLATRGMNLHWYGKEPRPGRKVGHLTLTGDSLATMPDPWHRA